MGKKRISNKNGRQLEWNTILSKYLLKIFKLLYFDFQELFGLHGTFWLYSCISCVGLFFVIMFVPETKGKDLDEMDPKYVRSMTINRWDLGTHVEYLV